MDASRAGRPQLTATNDEVIVMMVVTIIILTRNLVPFTSDFMVNITKGEYSTGRPRWWMCAVINFEPFSV
jgi:hypothetical protein